MFLKKTAILKQKPGKSPDSGSKTGLQIAKIGGAGKRIIEKN